MEGQRRSSCDFFLGDGEIGLNHKLWERGMLVGYVPEAIIYHHIPPQKMTVKYFRHRMASEGATDVYMRFHYGIPRWFRLWKHAAEFQSGMVNLDCRPLSVGKD